MDSGKPVDQYQDYILSKIQTVKKSGFDPVDTINPMLFDWQAKVVGWALQCGRAALFEDCGLGKTAQQLEWARRKGSRRWTPYLPTSTWCHQSRLASLERKRGYGLFSIHRNREWGLLFIENGPKIHRGRTQRELFQTSPWKLWISRYWSSDII